MKKQISQRVKRMVQWMGLACISSLLAAGCATNGGNGTYSDLPPDLAPINTNGGTNGSSVGGSAIIQDRDRFAIGDLVIVKLTGNVEPDRTHEERIKDDGNITLHLIGAVKAVGKSPGELQKEIHDLYVDEYYKRLTVVVTGEQRVYSVGGQVRQPGRQSYIGATTVTKAIQSAGDFTDFAAKRRVELTRPDGKRFIINCVKASNDPTLDLAVYPGDKIHVPMRDWRDLF